MISIAVVGKEPKCSSLGAVPIHQGSLVTVGLVTLNDSPNKTRKAVFEVPRRHLRKSCRLLQAGRYWLLLQIYNQLLIYVLVISHCLLPALQMLRQRLN